MRRAQSHSNAGLNSLSTVVLSFFSQAWWITKRPQFSNLLSHFAATSIKTWSLFPPTSWLWSGIGLALASRIWRTYQCDSFEPEPWEALPVPTSFCKTLPNAMNQPRLVNWRTRNHMEQSSAVSSEAPDRWESQGKINKVDLDTAELSREWDAQLQQITYRIMT